MPTTPTTPTNPGMPAELAELIALHRELFGGWKMEADTSDSGGETSEPSTPADEAPAPGADWKAEARKWEARAKANSAAAAKLAKLEEANKTELQKASDRATAAEAESASWKTRYQQLLTKQAVCDAAQAAGAIDAEAAHALLQGDITVDAEGRPLGVEQAVKALKARKPALFRESSPGANDAFGGNQTPALNSSALEDALRSALGA